MLEEEIANIRNRQTDILQLKNTIAEPKNPIHSFKSRYSHSEERISDLEDKTLETTQSENQMKQRKERKKRKEIVFAWEFQKKGKRREQIYLKQ